MYIEDLHIASALINKDETVTEDFFFKKSRPLFLSIISHVFSYEVDYDEFVNEFYVHLMENDAYRLKQFRGESSIYQWMKVVAIRYFIAKRNTLIDSTSKEPLVDMRPEGGNMKEADDFERKMEVGYLLGQMQNERYRQVIELLILNEMEPKAVAHKLNVSVDNLYNIKKRALEQLASVALKQTKVYG